MRNLCWGDAARSAVRPAFYAGICTFGLAGCTVEELTDRFVNIVTNTVDRPKVAFVEAEFRFSPDPVLTVIALQEDDTAIPIIRLNDFGAPGSINQISFAPDEAHLAVGHFEDAGSVFEARAFIYSVPDGDVAFFATDNTLSSEFETFCSESDAANPFTSLIPGEIANGGLPPDTDGIRFEFLDVAGNEITNLRWLSADVLLISARMEIAVTFVGPTQDVPFDPIGDMDVVMELTQTEADWQITGCSANGPDDIPIFTTTRDVVLGAEADEGQIIELDGAPLISLDTDLPIAPLGARLIDGPYTSP